MGGGVARAAVYSVWLDQARASIQSKLFPEIIAMSELTVPETRYALSGSLSIAYQVLGDQPIDLILVPGVVSHIEFQHELEGYTKSLYRLARFARVITFDKRGQGLSDKIAGAASLEERMDDVRAVMDAAGSSRAVLMGFSEGCAMSTLFAATYPDRVSHLVLYAGFAKGTYNTEAIEQRAQKWGNGDTIYGLAPSMLSAPKAKQQIAKLERLAASPGTLRSFLTLNSAIDVTNILPDIRVPTLSLHRTEDLFIPIKRGRELAARLNDAKVIEYAEADHAFWLGDTDRLIGDIQEFVTGHRNVLHDDDRVLATILFTDIVNSTTHLADLGDRKWKSMLDEHDRVANQIVTEHRGKVIKGTGDGLVAQFDGPGRGVRCALALLPLIETLGIQIRAGLHTGEIELRGNDIGGIAVHTAARIMAQSDPGEVLVSRVVTDLVAGAGLHFREKVTTDLKGLSGKWDLFSASN